MDLRNKLTDDEIDDICSNIEKSLEYYLGNEPLQVKPDDRQKMEDFLSIQYDMRLSDLLVEKHASMHSLDGDIKAELVQRKRSYFDRKNKEFLK